MAISVKPRRRAVAKGRWRGGLSSKSSPQHLLETLRQYY
jgi:hypothetical protein